MATRMCSLCGEIYTDELGHNYDKCVIACQENLERYLEQKKHLNQVIVDQTIHLEEARRIQKQDWWRTPRVL